MKADKAIATYRRMRAQPLWRLLASTTGPTVIGLLQSHLYESERSLPASIFHERIARDLEELRAQGEDFPQTAQAYVASWLADGFLEFWREFYSILRVLDLGAAEKDDRFQQRCNQLLVGPTEGLADAFGAQRSAGRISKEIDPRAVAAVLTSMLAHVAPHRTGLREWGAGRAELVDAMARVIHCTLLERVP